MAIFNSYVKLPEGIYIYIYIHITVIFPGYPVFHPIKSPWKSAGWMPWEVSPRFQPREFLRVEVLLEPPGWNPRKIKIIVGFSTFWHVYPMTLQKLLCFFGEICGMNSVLWRNMWEHRGIWWDLIYLYIYIIYIIYMTCIHTLQSCPLKPFFIMGQDTSDRYVLLLQCDEPQL